MIDNCNKCQNMINGMARKIFKNKSINNNNNNNLNNYNYQCDNLIRKEKINDENLNRKNNTCAYTIDIVVCVHNAWEYVQECLDSLFDKKTVDFNLIIIDDGSDEETKKKLENFAKNHKILIHRNREAQGYTISANIGLQLSNSDYVILLNSDTVVTYGWIEKLVECSTVDKITGIVSPLSNAASWQTIPEVFNNGDWKINELPEKINLDMMGMIVENASIKEYPTVPFLNGFCLCIKRDVIDKIGHFDEMTFPKGYGEENDYCIRALQSGFKLRIADNCYIFHEKSKSYSNERRKVLSSHASVALKNKYGEEYINNLLKQMKSDFTLNKIRLRILDLINYYNMNFNLIDKKICFLLPVNGGNGGANSVVQETKGLRLMGLNVEIVNKQSCYSTFIKNYPEVKEYTNVYQSIKDLENILSKYDVVIATVYHTVENINEICKKYPHIKVAYYSQDYEPLFFNSEHEDYRKAKESYELMKNNLIMAKTDWICNEIYKNHSVRVSKVIPSLDWEYYNPNIIKKINKNDNFTITAMIRPSTARRGSSKTLELLKMLKCNNPSIDIKLFGCMDKELYKYSDMLDFNFENRGLLSRYDVTKLLSVSDIFIDMSEYQAFGRTGLEALAVGCISILPQNGGVYEYALNGINSLIVNTDDVNQVFNQINYLLKNPETIYRMKIAGINTAKNYSILKSAWSEMWVLNSLFKNSKDENRNIGLLYTKSGMGSPTGSAYYRVISPYESIRLYTKKFRCLNILTESIGCMDLDFIVIQRDVIKDIEIANRVIENSKAVNTKIIYEIDDYIWENSEVMKYIAQNSDGVIVTTEEIAVKMRALNSNVYIIDNYLDSDVYGYVQEMLRSKKHKEDGEKENINRGVFIGTKTHYKDLLMVQPVLDKLNSQEDFNIDLIGFRVPFLGYTEIKNDNLSNFIKSIIETIDEYSFGIAPLENTEFNTCKSKLKYLEYTMYNLPGVYSNLGSFKKYIDQYRGVLVNNNEEWYEEINNLNSKKQESILKNAKKDVECNCLMSKGYIEWLIILENLIKR